MLCLTSLVISSINISLSEFDVFLWRPSLFPKHRQLSLIPTFLPAIGSTLFNPFLFHVYSPLYPLFWWYPIFFNKTQTYSTVRIIVPMATTKKQWLVSIFDRQKGKLVQFFWNPPVKLQWQHSGIRFFGRSQHTIFGDQFFLQYLSLETLSALGKDDNNNILANNFPTNLLESNKMIKKTSPLHLLTGLGALILSLIVYLV